MSDRSISRILHDADLKPHRQRMWLTSQDDEFREKRDDVLRVYYESPRNEHIVCVDEKTGMQALERRYADVPMVPGQPILFAGYCFGLRAARLFMILRSLAFTASARTCSV